MTSIPRDTSRDSRIEDPTNTYLVHAAAHRLVGPAIRAGISANAVSFVGLGLGGLAALAYSNWRDPWLATLGFALSVAWLVADGLDGKIARATGTSSALGRVLDGICDHGVFALLYVATAASIATPEAWALAVAAGLAHAVQSTLYEAERARFHRRAAGDPGKGPRPARTGNPLERLYDRVAGSLEPLARRFDDTLAASPEPAGLTRRYVAKAAPALKAMTPLSANTRVIAIWLACLIGDPRLYWWLEIVPLSLLAVGTIVWHRRVEAVLAAAPTAVRPDPDPSKAY